MPYGLLPQYRGMDCTYWCVLNQDYGNIGFTTDLMDAGVDTGPIVDVNRVDVTRFATIDDVVYEIEYQMAEAITAAVSKVFSGAADYCPQQSEDGLQYFTIVPECLSLAHRSFVSQRSRSRL